MKKSLIALAVLAAAGTASAQSSVTVFGVLDAAVRHVDNGKDSQTQLVSGGLSTSRIGFRGTEDLGGGLKAGFWLEGAVNVDNGTGGKGAGTDTGHNWQRRSTLSLMSDSLGEVRLGRDLLPGYTAISDFDPFGDTGIGATFATVNPAPVNTPKDSKTQKRASNSVSYLLPNTLGGVYGQFTHAFGEDSANEGSKYTGGRLGFRNGGLDLTAGYSEAEYNTDDLKITVLSAAYDFGVAKLQGSYMVSKFGDNKETHYVVGGSVPVGNFLLRAAYSVNDSDDVAGRDADHFAIGAVYNLSKRTALYGTYAVIDNDRGATFAVHPIKDNNVFAAPAAGKSDKGYEIGVRHSF